MQNNKYFENKMLERPGITLLEKNSHQITFQNKTSM